MSKRHHSNRGLLLLCCAAGIAFLGEVARPAGGGDPHGTFLPVIFRSPPSHYLPLIFKNGAPNPYVLQPGSPFYLANFINTSGCDWFGIAGRAFGLDGNPVINLTVHLEGGGRNTDALTGSGPASLGPGSYEIDLGDHPLETSGVYFIQLRNNAGMPLSDVYMIPTHGQCNMNLVLVNFVHL